ncbi:MAG: PKD domain-containing protein [Solirubrobacterales bacterium]
MTRGRYLFFPLGLLVALAILPASASAKDGTVTVSAPGTDPSQVTVRLAALGSPDINNQAYALSSGRKQVSGYSMRRVLEEAEKEAGGWLDLATIPSIEVDLPTAGVIRLSRAEALDRNYFTDGPPVFYENNGTTVFLMPGSPGREYTFSFAPVGMKVGSGLDFDVRISATPSRPKRGQSVAFTAKVKGAPDGASLSYRWTFSDGTTRTTSSPKIEHTFEGTGRRSVVLVVSGGGGEGQAALSLDVSPSGGGDSGGNGGTPSGNPAPVTPEASIYGTGGGGGGYGSSSSTGSGGSGAGTPVAPAGQAPPEQTKRSRKAGQSPDGLKEVSGLLIDPSASAAQSAVPEAAPKDSGAGGPAVLGLSGEAATLFGVGLLIALGGLIEARVLVRRP